MIQTGTTVALSDNWLDGASDTITAVDCNGVSTSTVFCTCNAHPCQCWHAWTYPVYYPTYISGPSKARLTVDDINRLRAAAKKDTKLKAILQKLTPHIEVEVEL